MTNSVNSHSGLLAPQRMVVRLALSAGEDRAAVHEHPACVLSV
jgi:hypothetical protein